MILYENQCYHYGDASFSLPDGFYFRTLEVETDDGFAMCSPDMDYQIEYFCFEDDTATKEDLIGFFSEISEPPIMAVTPICINGLSGHQTAYISNGEQFCELLFDVSDGKRIRIVVRTEGDILTLMEKPELMTALKQIKKEK